MKYLAIAISTALFAAGAHASGLDVQEGYWESLVRIEIKGSPFPIPAFKTGKCITRSDLIPNSVQSPERCRMLSQEVRGNDVNWRLRCQDDKGVMEGTGRITYASDRYKGGMDMVITDIAKGRQATMHYVLEGRRVGACGQAK